MAQPYVMASGQVTRKFLGPQYHEHGALWVSGEGHTGFDEDIWPCLKPPGAHWRSVEDRVASVISGADARIS
jgi:hypothetical protein